MEHSTWRNLDELMNHPCMTKVTVVLHFRTDRDQFDPLWKWGNENSMFLKQYNRRLLKRSQGYVVPGSCPHLGPRMNLESPIDSSSRGKLCKPCSMDKPSYCYCPQLDLE